MGATHPETPASATDDTVRVLRVLLVEDDDTKAQLITRILKSHAKRRDLSAIELTRYTTLAELDTNGETLWTLVITDWRFPFVAGHREPAREGAGAAVADFARGHGLPFLIVSSSQRPSWWYEEAGPRTWARPGRWNEDIRQLVDRALEVCPYCDGAGQVDHMHSAIGIRRAPESEDLRDCEDCSGTGRLDR